MASSTSSPNNHFLSFLLSRFSDRSVASTRRVFFRLADRHVRPSVVTGDEGPLEWDEITDRAFEEHLLAFRGHFERELRSRGVKDKEVVPLWLTGRRYEDMLAIFSISLAGFVPRVISTMYNASFVVAMLSPNDNSATVVVTDPAVTELAREALEGKQPQYTLVEVPDLSTLPPVPEDASIRDNFPSVFSADAAAVYHSSGTTSLSAPKSIIISHASLLNNALHKMPSCAFQGSYDSQEVVNTFSNMALIAATLIETAAIAHGACIVHAPFFRDVAPHEVLLMVKNCGLNRIIMFGNSMTKHLSAAKSNEELWNTLKAMRQVTYCGIAISDEEDRYARKNGLPMTTFYGSTELGPQLTSVIGTEENDMLVRKAAGATTEFVVPKDMELESSQAQLYEAVVSASSPEAPHHTFIRADGYYHTDDLFDQPAPGLYRWRGRTGDFIKQTEGYPLFLNAKHIEENVQMICSEFITGAAVVAAPSGLPCLIVEAGSAGRDVDKEGIKRRVLERITSFNNTLMAHERFTDSRLLLVVDEGTIPKNKMKGNVRRPATAAAFKIELMALESAFRESHKVNGASGRHD